jgi:hypothetical protein
VGNEVGHRNEEVGGMRPLTVCGKKCDGSRGCLRARCCGKISFECVDDELCEPIAKLDRNPEGHGH